MKRILKISGIVLVSLLVITIATSMIAEITPISLNMHSPVFEKYGYALEGFDAVSYFKGKPEKGTESYRYEWNGSQWLFSSTENRNEFMANPEKFVPQFGGYCTKAVSTGFTAPGDPEVWLVKDEMLYIFSGEEVKNEFLENPRQIIEACAKEWR